MELNESPRLVRLIALAAATVVLSALPANAARDSDMRSLKLTFYAEDATSKTLKDSVPFGDTPTKGDVIRLTWRLVNSGRQFGRASGATVGTAVQTFTFTSRSKAAVPIQSCSASSSESLIPMRRCSGESTKNSPPKDQKAWPPRDCSGS